MKSLKLEMFREKMIEQIKRYPGYQIGEYFNTEYSSIKWLGVFDYDTHLRVAEVIVVERFSSNDTPCDSLLLIDYVNSDSRRYDDIEQALSFMETILTVASDRKKACEIKIDVNVDGESVANAVCEQQENQIHLESLRADGIKTGVIDPNKFYLITGRRNGKTLLYQNILKSLFGFKIKEVIFNDPATVVFWGDGSKTIVQCQNGEPFDPEKGLAMAISKKVYGNKYDYYEIFKKWVGKYRKKKFREALDKVVEAKPKEDETKNPREGTNFNDYLNEQLKDPEFKKQYENTEVLKPYCDTSKENDNEQ